MDHFARWLEYETNFLLAALLVLSSIFSGRRARELLRHRCRPAAVPGDASGSGFRRLVLTRRPWIRINFLLRWVVPGTTTTTVWYASPWYNGPWYLRGTLIYIPNLRALGADQLLTNRHPGYLARLGIYEPGRPRWGRALGRASGQAAPQTSSNRGNPRGKRARAAARLPAHLLARAKLSPRAGCSSREHACNFAALRVSTAGSASWQQHYERAAASRRPQPQAPQARDDGPRNPAAPPSDSRERR